MSYEMSGRTAHGSTVVCEFRWQKIMKYPNINMREKNKFPKCNMHELKYLNEMN